MEVSSQPVVMSLLLPKWICVPLLKHWSPPPRILTTNVASSWCNALPTINWVKVFQVFLGEAKIPSRTALLLSIVGHDTATICTYTHAPWKRFFYKIHKIKKQSQTIFFLFINIFILFFLKRRELDFFFKTGIFFSL